MEVFGELLVLQIQIQIIIKGLIMVENTENKKNQSNNNYSDVDIAKLVKSSEKLQLTNESLQTKLTEMENANSERVDKDKKAKDEAKKKNEEWQTLATEKEAELATKSTELDDYKTKYDALAMDVENERLRLLNEIVEVHKLSDEEKESIKDLNKKQLTVFSKMKKEIKKADSGKEEAAQDKSGGDANPDDIYGYNRLNKDSDKQKNSMANTYSQAMNKQ